MAHVPIPPPSQQWTVESSSHHVTLNLLLLPPSFAYHGTCDYFGRTQVIQDNNPSISRPLTTSAKSPLPHTKYSQIPGIRMWASLGVIILPTTQGNLNYQNNYAFVSVGHEGG